VPVQVGALEERDGVKVKSAGMIKDSDGIFSFHLIINTTTSNSLASANLINIQY